MEQGKHKVQFWIWAGGVDLSKFPYPISSGDKMEDVEVTAEEIFQLSKSYEVSIWEREGMTVVWIDKKGQRFACR